MDKLDGLNKETVKLHRRIALQVFKEEKEKEEEKRRMKGRMRGREEGLQLFTHTQSRSLSVDRCTPFLFAPLLPNREAFPQTLTTIRSSLSIDEVFSLLINPLAYGHLGRMEIAFHSNQSDLYSQTMQCIM